MTEDIFNETDADIESHRKKALVILKKGKTLTALEALYSFGCGRLASRIFELRNQGYNIKTELVNENKKRFAKYRLIQ